MHSNIMHARNQPHTSNGETMVERRFICDEKRNACTTSLRKKKENDELKMKDEKNSIQILMNRLVELTMSHGSHSSLEKQRLETKYNETCCRKKFLKAKAYETLFKYLQSQYRQSNGNETFNEEFDSRNMTIRDRMHMEVFQLRLMRRFDCAQHLEDLVDSFGNEALHDEVTASLYFLLALRGTSPVQPPDSIGFQSRFPHISTSAQQIHKTLLPTGALHYDDTCLSVASTSTHFLHFSKEVFVVEGNRDLHVSSHYSLLDNSVFDLTPSYESRTVQAKSGISCQAATLRSYNSVTASTLFSALTQSKVSSTSGLEVFLDLPDISVDGDWISVRDLHFTKFHEISEDEGFVDNSSSQPSLISSPVQVKQSSYMTCLSDDNLWQMALTSDPISKHRTWEQYGCIGECSRERPYLTEAGSEAFDAARRAQQSRHLLIDSSLCPPSEVKITNSELMRDIHYLLVGVPSQCFQLQDNRFILRLGLYKSGVSPEALAHACKYFLRAGTNLYHLNQFVCHSSPLECRFSLVSRAFRAGLCAYLHQYVACILFLPISDTLLEIERRIDGLAQQIKFLAHLCMCDDETDFSVEESIAKFPVSADLLSYLYKECLATALGPFNLLMLSLFRAAFDPYLVLIQEWVFHGELRNVDEQFLVQANDEYLYCRDHRYWSDVYTLAKDRPVNADQVVPIELNTVMLTGIPEFLRDLAANIHVCGKSLNLLRICNPQHFLFGKAVDSDMPQLRLLFSTSEVDSLENLSHAYLGRLRAVAIQSTRTRETLRRRIEEAKHELIVRARTVATKELNRIQDRVLVLKTKEDVRKRKAFAELETQMQNELKRKKDEIERVKMEDKERSEASKRQNLPGLNIDRELEQLAREELIDYYRKLSEDAVYRERRAQWRVRRHQLAERRFKFLSADAKLNADMLLGSIPRSNTDDVVLEFNEHKTISNETLQSSSVTKEVSELHLQDTDHSLDRETIFPSEGILSGPSIDSSSSCGTESMTSFLESGSVIDIKELETESTLDMQIAPDDIKDLPSVFCEDIDSDVTHEGTVTPRHWIRLPNESAGVVDSVRIASSRNNKPLHSNKKRKINFPPIVRLSGWVQHSVRTNEEYQQMNKPFLDNNLRRYSNTVDKSHQTSVLSVSLQAESRLEFSHIASVPGKCISMETEFCVVKPHQASVSGKCISTESDMWNNFVEKSHIASVPGKFISMETESNVVKSHQASVLGKGVLMESVSDVEKSHLKLVPGKSVTMQTESIPDKFHQASVSGRFATMETLEVAERVHTASVPGGSASRETKQIPWRSQIKVTAGKSTFVNSGSHFLPGFDSDDYRSFQIRPNKNRKVSGECIDRETVEPSSRTSVKINADMNSTTESTATDPDIARMERFHSRNMRGHSSDSSIQLMMYRRSVTSDLKAVDEESESLTFDVDRMSSNWEDTHKTEPYIIEFNNFDMLPNVDMASWQAGLDTAISRAASDHSDSDFSTKDQEIVCLPVLIRRIVMAPLLAQISIVNQSVLDYFMVDVEMETHFRLLRSFVLLQDGEFSRCLTDELFEKLSKSRNAIELLNPVYLNNVLHKATSQSLTGNTHKSRNISFLLKSSKSTSESDVLNSLELTYKVDWPANVLITDSRLKQYGRLFKFLLLIKRTHWVIKDIFHRLKHAVVIHGASQATEMRVLHLYRYEMEHFVKVLQEYVANQVGHVSWHEFLAELEDKSGAVHSLDDLIQCHTKYLTKCTSRCLLNKKALPVMKIICDVFESIVMFSKQLVAYDWTNNRNDKRKGGVIRRGGAPVIGSTAQQGSVEFSQLCVTYQSFHSHSTFLFKVVTSLAACGYEAHLDELLLRLNFNGFYQSDNHSNKSTRRRNN